MACRSWPASFLVRPAKSAGIACYNACGTCGGFGAPRLLARLWLSECKLQDVTCAWAAVGPYLIGYMSDHYSMGFSAPMYLLGAFNVLSSLLIIGVLLLYICTVRLQRIHEQWLLRDALLLSFEISEDHMVCAARSVPGPQLHAGAGRGTGDSFSQSTGCQAF